MVMDMATVMVTVMEVMLVALLALSRDPIAVATTASARRDGCTARDMDMVRRVLCAIKSILFKPKYIFPGKKYCYGSTKGEYCHCDYCKCKHGFGEKGYGKCH